MSGATGVSSEVGGNPQGPFCAAGCVFCPTRSPSKPSADNRCEYARHGLLQASSWLKSTVLIILQVTVFYLVFDLFAGCVLPIGLSFRFLTAFSLSSLLVFFSAFGRVPWSSWSYRPRDGTGLRCLGSLPLLLPCSDFLLVPSQNPISL